MARLSGLEDTLAFQIRAAGLPAPEREFAVVPGRRFRFDFAWPEFQLLLEVQGGTWGKGAHSSGVGIARDCEKANLAVIEGWNTFHVTSEQIKAGKAIYWLQAYFKAYS